MSKYLFETNDFGISESGIHLLRSRFNYETIDFKDIRKLEITKDKELNNWWIILVIGIILISFGYKTVEAIVNYFMNPSGVIYIETIVVPIIPLIFGVYCVYASLKIGIVLKFTTHKGKNYKYPLSSISKEGKTEELKKFLEAKVS